MRSLPLGQASEDRIVGNLGTRLELLQPPQKGTQQFQSACPGEGVSATVTVASRPVGHDFDGQWATMTDRLNMFREAA
jgi:hypothetical protein